MLKIIIIAQNNYYATDSTMSIGIKLIDGSDKSNSTFCLIEEKNKIVRYTPYDIKEYGFSDGRVYISKEIHLHDSTTKVFLEQLSKGKATLYYYKGKQFKMFFLRKDSTTFIEIPKKNKEGVDYNFQLMKLTNDCSNVIDATKLVSYNKKSLTKLIKRYNDCKLKPFPHFKYGLYIGYEFVKLIPASNSDNINQFDIRYNGGPIFGLYIDNPILVSDFSLHTGLIFSKQGFTYNYKNDNKDIDFVANTSSIKVPVLIRYSYPSNKLRPFINLGGLITLNIKNENSIYESVINQNIIEINELSKQSLLPYRLVGFSAGGGAEYKINYRNSLFFELRFNKLSGSSDSETIKNSEILFITGFNL